MVRSPEFAERVRERSRALREEKKRYDIWWCSEWDCENDECAGAMVKMFDTDSIIQADLLVPSILGLAFHKYGRGFLVVLDEDGRRIGRLNGVGQRAA